MFSLYFLDDIMIDLFQRFTSLDITDAGTLEYVWGCHCGVRGLYGLLAAIYSFIERMLPLQNCRIMNTSLR